MGLSSCLQFLSLLGELWRMSYSPHPFPGGGCFSIINTYNWGDILQIGFFTAFPVTATYWGVFNDTVILQHIVEERVTQRQLPLKCVGIFGKLCCLCGDVYVGKPEVIICTYSGQCFINQESFPVLVRWVPRVKPLATKLGDGECLRVSSGIHGEEKHQLHKVLLWPLHMHCIHTQTHTQVNKTHMHNTQTHHTQTDYTKTHNIFMIIISEIIFKGYFYWPHTITFLLGRSWRYKYFIFF